MNNVTLEGYASLYGGAITEQDFSRLSYNAFRIMDDLTTGIDGFHKLRYAAPVDEYDAKAVERCGYALIHALRQMEALESSAGVVARDDGSVVHKRVSSVSSGAESITYASGSAITAIEAAVADTDKRKAFLLQTAREYLSGARDSHGVNLLYMGVYPRV